MNALLRQIARRELNQLSRVGIGKCAEIGMLKILAPTPTLAGCLCEDLTVKSILGESFCLNFLH